MSSTKRPIYLGALTQRLKHFSVPPLPCDLGQRPRPCPPSTHRRPAARPAATPARWARRRRWLSFGLLAGILLIAAALRLPNLATNPGWDGDEGYNLNIAMNLAHGHHQMFALDFVFVQHPPLFFGLAALLIHVLGATMAPLRLLSVAFCLGTLLLLPALTAAVVDARGGAARTGSRGSAARTGSRGGAARTGSRGGAARTGSRGGAAQVNDRLLATYAGLLAALAYAVLPVVVLQNRFGYTYNGLAFWSTLALLGVLRDRQGHRPDQGRGSRWMWLAVAGVASAAARATDQEGIYLFPLLLFGLSGGLPRRLAACLLALCGPAIYVGAMILTERSALLFDITHTAGRVAGGSPVWQIETWVYALADLARFDPAIPLGLAGLILIPGRAARRTVLLLLAAMLLVILKVRDPNPLFRAAEPLLPLVCLGLGVLGGRSWAWAVRQPSPIPPASGTPLLSHARERGSGVRGGRGRFALAAVCAGAVFLAALPVMASDVHAALDGFRTPIDGSLPRSTARARSMAAWLNARLRPSDTVLAMPQVSWLVHSRTADLLQAVARGGGASAFYPAGIARARWVYDPRPDAARYLVVDDFTRAWIAQFPAERSLVRHAQHTWRLVYVHGEYQVYENPNYV